MLNDLIEAFRIKGLILNKKDAIKMIKIINEKEIKEVDDSLYENFFKGLNINTKSKLSLKTGLMSFIDKRLSELNDLEGEFSLSEEKIWFQGKRKNPENKEKIKQLVREAFSKEMEYRYENKTIYVNILGVEFPYSPEYKNYSVLIRKLKGKTLSAGLKILKR